MTTKQPVKRARKRAPKPKVTAVQSTQRVSMNVTQSGATVEDNETIERDVHVFVTDPAYVRVNAGVTKKIGEYESLRVDVSITMPCYKEVVDETFTELSDKVALLLDNEVDQYMGVEND